MADTPENSCPCRHCAAEGEGRSKKSRKAAALRVCAGTVLFAAALAPTPLSPAVVTALFAGAYLLIGGDVLLRALGNIRRGRVFDENFLMTLATIGAFAIGEYPEAAAVMLFYQVGEAFQDYALGRSRASIAALMDIRPDYANLKTGGEIRRVSPEEVAVGDLIVVGPGERVPLDGVVAEGVSALDTSALTGESLPRDCAPGTEVLSGSINTTGLLALRVTKTAGESTAAKILSLVESAGSRKAKMEHFITKFARWYTPAVVFAALGLALIPPLVIRFALGGEASFQGWIHRALIFLVVSCPCALVISIPLGFFGGIGCASKHGVLVKGGNYLEALCAVDTAVFDKTGTLTRGAFGLTEIAPAPGFSLETLLEKAAYAECFSTHPIALSIRKAFLEGGSEIDKERVSDYEDIPGRGVKAKVDGEVTLAGKREFLEEQGVVVPEGGAASVGAAVFVAVEGAFAGRLSASDEPKADAAETLSSLKKLGVRRTVMLTGDSRGAAERLGQALGLDCVMAELLPQDKVARLEELEAARTSPGCVLYVGDGINDAPVLARSGVGVAMGGLGSDAAIEAADVVLMTDELSKLTDALRIARKTRAVVRQNVAIALGVKALILVMGAFGAATMWEAVFGDVGVAVIAILNSMRTLRYRP